MPDLSDHIDFIVHSFSDALPNENITPEMLMIATVKTSELMGKEEIDEEDVSLLSEKMLEVVESIPEDLYASKEELISYLRDELNNKLDLNSSPRY